MENKELIKKLKKEFDELKIKTEKLWDYIHTNIEFMNLDYLHMNLLSTQYNLMVSYGNILLARISFLENKNDKK